MNNTWRHVHCGLVAVRFWLLFDALCLSSLAFSADCRLMFLHAAFELLPFLLLWV